MDSNIGFKDTLTFGASILVGCAAAIAIASAAAVSHAAPSPRSDVRSAPEVVRLDPVVVTVSRLRFAAVRDEEAALARAADVRKVARG